MHLTFFSDDESESDSGCLFLSASQDQNIHLWQYSLSGPTNEGNDIINDSNTTSADSTVLLHQFKGHARSVDALAVSPNKQEVGVSTT